MPSRSDSSSLSKNHKYTLTNNDTDGNIHSATINDEQELPPINELDEFKQLSSITEEEEFTLTRSGCVSYLYNYARYFPKTVYF